MGITSECVLIWNARLTAERSVTMIFWGVLALYVPGSYVLYTHMMVQRRKVIRGKGIEGRLE